MIRQKGSKGHSSHCRIWLFATPWTAAHQASLSFTVSQSLLRCMSIKSVCLSNHLILCQPLLLLPSIFPSIRVFSHESALHIRWPKYWSFSISPCNEYSGLISFRKARDIEGSWYSNSHACGETDGGTNSCGGGRGAQVTGIFRSSKDWVPPWTVSSKEQDWGEIDTDVNLSVFHFELPKRKTSGFFAGLSIFMLYEISSIPLTLSLYIVSSLADTFKTHKWRTGVKCRWRLKFKLASD